MGYGYGVWIVIKDPDILEVIATHNEDIYLPHVTIMCNMKRNEARKLSDELKNTYNITIGDDYVAFSGRYSAKDDLLASGYWVDIEDWTNIRSLAEKYTGSLPSRPHISLAYREEGGKLPTSMDLKSRTIVGEAVIANIRAHSPESWKVIE